MKAASATPPPNLAAFGMDNFAYVKSVEIDGQQYFAIHAADGTPLTVIQNREVANITVRHYDMQPLSVH